jgi:hypothetical protein
LVFISENPQKLLKNLEKSQKIKILPNLFFPQKMAKKAPKNTKLVPRYFPLKKSKIPPQLKKILIQNLWGFK